jgi:uncharacterized protein (DUF2236 family)
MLSIIPLPHSLQRRLEAAALAFLNSQNERNVDFTQPAREEALVPPTSVSWRIFKNPIALFIGGIAAVILELAEPAIRTAVWEHSTFREDPIRRLRRTGLAAMVTVYGPRSVAEPMIAAIRRIHGTIAGETPSGARYSASDPRLIAWVHTTATYCFAQAYSRYVRLLDPSEFDALYEETLPAARLYGAFDAPASAAATQILFESMRGKLEPSPIIFEFLKIMREAAAFPRPLQWMQPMLVRAAVETRTSTAYVRTSGGW